MQSAVGLGKTEYFIKCMGVYVIYIHINRESKPKHLVQSACLQIKI